MSQSARILIRDVVTASATDTVRSAARRMRQAGIGCIVVAEGKTAVGIFSERDLLNRVAADGLDLETTTLAQVMTPKPLCVDSSEPLDKVFGLLAEGRFRHVPITENGELVGIVSLSDLAKVLRNVYKEEKYTQYFIDYMQE